MKILGADMLACIAGLLMESANQIIGADLSNSYALKAAFGRPRLGWLK